MVIITSQNNKQFISTSFCMNKFILFLTFFRKSLEEVVISFALKLRLKNKNCCRSASYHDIILKKCDEFVEKVENSLLF